MDTTKVEAITYPEKIENGVTPGTRLEIASRLMEGLLRSGFERIHNTTFTDTAIKALDAADALIEQSGVSGSESGLIGRLRIRIRELSERDDAKWKEQISAYMRIINEYRQGRRFHVHKDGLDEAMDGVSEHHIYPGIPGLEDEGFIIVVQVPEKEAKALPYPTEEIGEYRDCDQIIAELLEENTRLAHEIDRLKSLVGSGFDEDGPVGM